MRRLTTELFPSASRFGSFGQRQTFAFFDQLLQLDHKLADILEGAVHRCETDVGQDRKSTRLNSSHQIISYAVFCLKKKKNQKKKEHLQKHHTDNKYISIHNNFEHNDD